LLAQVDDLGDVRLLDERSEEAALNGETAA
jgi:hypothetical protein